MDSQFISFQFLFPILLFLLILSTLYKKKKPKSYKPTNLPPGPKKLPIIGNMHQMAGALPHRKLTELAKRHGPIMHLQLGEIKAIVISSPEMAKEVMKTHDILFASRPYLPALDVITYGSKNLVFAPYGEYWRQLRKICVLELLSSKRVQSFQTLREEEMKKMVSFISSNEGSIFNLSSTLVSSSYGFTAKAVFGKKSKHQEAYIATMKGILGLTGGFSVVDVFPSSKFLCMISGVRAKLEKSQKTLDLVIEEIINEHRAVRKAKSSDASQDADDLVDVLLGLQDDGSLEVPLTMDNVKAVIQVMMEHFCPYVQETSPAKTLKNISRAKKHLQKKNTEETLKLSPKSVDRYSSCLFLATPLGKASLTKHIAGFNNVFNVGGVFHLASPITEHA